MGPTGVLIGPEEESSSMLIHAGMVLMKDSASVSDGMSFSMRRSWNSRLSERIPCAHNPR